MLVRFGPGQISITAGIRIIAIVVLALCCRFQSFGGRIQLVLEALAAGNLIRQGQAIGGAGPVGGLRLLHKVRNVGFELRPQHLNPVIAQRLDLRGIGINLRAIHGHHADLEDVQFPGQQKDLRESGRKRCPIVAPEFGNRIVIGVAVGGDEPDRDIAIARLLNPARGKIPLA